MGGIRVKWMKGMVLRELVEEGRRMLALSLYKQGKASFGKASKIAGVTVSEFLDLLKEFGVTANVTVQDFKENLLYAKKISIVK